jgi:hypothetical protein
LIDHRVARLALRAKLLTLSVCSTGLVELESTATGYRRATGSFITDGFAIGMEVSPSGFTQDAPGVITSLTATELTIKGGRVVEASSAGRELSVGVPSDRAWENSNFDPTAGVPYVSEEYLPGPTEVITLGPQGEVEGLPMYLIRFFVPINTDSGAGDGYAGAALETFAPRTSTAVGFGTLRVRTDTAPYRGQLTRMSTGFAVVPVTIPLRARAANAI